MNKSIAYRVCVYLLPPQTYVSYIFDEEESYDSVLEDVKWKI
jgi:hypothetical protein